METIAVLLIVLLLASKGSILVDAKDTEDVEQKVDITITVNEKGVETECQQ